MRTSELLWAMKTTEGATYFLTRHKISKSVESGSNNSENVLLKDVQRDALGLWILVLMQEHAGFHSSHIFDRSAVLQVQ